MTKPILHTKRFTLYPWNNDEKHNLHLRQMMQSEKVQKYIRGHAYSEDEVDEAFIRWQKNSTNKFGMWMIYKGDICAGMCLLKAMPSEVDHGYYETGYWLKPSHWGMGIAGETATRMVQYAFEDLKLPCVVGVVDEDNIGSMKSLEKAGLTRRGTILAYDKELPFFKINNPNITP